MDYYFCIGDVAAFYKRSSLKLMRGVGLLLEVVRTWDRLVSSSFVGIFYQHKLVDKALKVLQVKIKKQRCLNEGKQRHVHLIE